MARTRNLRCVALAIGLLIGSTASAADLPEPGPDREGLRLRLTVEKAKEQPGYDFTLQLLNVSDKPVQLVAEYFYETAAPFETYFRESIHFTSYPEVQPSHFGSSGEERTTPQPTATIKPGGSLSTGWRVNCCELGGSEETNEVLVLLRPGLYLIRAHGNLRTADGRHVKLWSNEQPFSTDGSQSAPAASTATLKFIETDANSGKPVLELDVGEEDGVAVGDLFDFGDGKTSYWRLKVTQVEARASTAVVVEQDSMEPGQANFPPQFSLGSYTTP